MRTALCLLALLAACPVFATESLAAPAPTPADVRAVVAAPTTWTTNAPLRRSAAACRESWCRPECGWVVSLPIWVPGVAGNLAVGDASFQPADLKRSEGGSSQPQALDLGILDRGPDVATALEFAFVGAVTHYRGPWSVGVDAFGLRIGNELTFQFNGAEVDSEFRAGIGRLWVAYRFSQHRLRLWDAQRPAVAEHEIYVGTRFSWASFKATLPSGTRTKAERNWFDPIIGLRSHLHLRNGWSVLLQADIGGFGVSSEFAWSFLGGLTYRFSRKFSLTLAWSILDLDYRRTLRSIPFDIDLQLSGPHLGMSFYF